MCRDLAVLIVLLEMTSRVVLLGPQRFRPTLRDTVRSLGVRGAVAMVTAGWQEREREDRELRAHLDCEVSDLLLYHRYDDVLLRDRELAAALHERQEQLQELQELYRVRLAHALAAAHDLIDREGESDILEEQRSAALQTVRQLDRHHLQRIRRVHRDFDERWQPERRTALARHLEQLQRILARVELLGIAGGHIAVLLNRMRLFQLPRLLERLPVVAWSAGAMAVSQRVVLFHDSPPQGAGNPEVLDAGLGMCRHIVPLPHARSRLRLDDAARVSLFAQRFAPASCVVLEDAARVDWNGEAWSAAPGTLRLGAQGQLVEMLGS